MRIALVVQRYGLDINGGAEFQCRQIAEHLAKFMRVEVLTTCAEDHYSWRNVYPAGPERINNILIRRFPVDHERDMARFGELSQRLLSDRHTYFDELQWMELQGPTSSELLRFLDRQQEAYDLFIFFTYLYASTYFGLQVVPHKAVLLAEAHDEPWIRLRIFRSLFHLPRAFVFNTIEEQRLIHRIFHNEYIPGQVLGSGIEVQRLAEIAAARSVDVFQKYPRLRVGDDFVIYVGRVDPSKGCNQLFEYFLRYKMEHQTALKLVLIGKSTMPIPDHPDIIALGFLREEPFPWMAQARALVLPSEWESFSFVVLESMALGVPVLVNGASKVTRGHCQRSNGGLYFRGYDEFSAALSLLLVRPELRRNLGRQGQAYVKQNYAWEVIERRFVDWVTWVAQRQVKGWNHDAEGSWQK